MDKPNLEYTPIDQRLLTLFANQKYHWQTLTKEHQLSMARELLRSRKLIREFVDLWEQVNKERKLTREVTDLWEKENENRT